MSKLEFFVSQDRLSRIAEIFVKFSNVVDNWKFQKLKNSFKNLLKNWDALWQGNLRNWHSIGTLALLLAR